MRRVTNKNHFLSGGNIPIYIRAVLFISLLAILQPSFSQVRDSLNTYLSIAAQNNPAVLQRYAEYRAALEKIPQVGSLPDPQLEMGIFLSPMELVNGRQTAEIRLMQMFPWFGVLQNARDEMSLMAKAKFEILRDARYQVYYDVQRAWYELFRIRKEIDISEKNIELLKVIEKLALVSYRTAPAGNTGSVSQNSRGIQGSSSQGSLQEASSSMQGMTGNRGGSVNTSSSQQRQSQMPEASMTSSGSGLSDIYRIQMEKADLESRTAFLKDQEETIAARFNALLNRSPRMAVFTADTLIADTLLISISAVADSVKDNNPMLSMIDYEKQSYNARRKMNRGMGFPMIGLGLNYSAISNSEMAADPSMNGRDMVMPMLTLTLPVYRKKYRAMQKEAGLLEQASSYNYESASDNLQVEYYQAVQMYKDASRRIKLYDSQFAIASRSLEITLKSFSASSAELTDILRIRQQVYDYELRKVESVADLNTSIAWLNRLMGSLNFD